MGYSFDKKKIALFLKKVEGEIVKYSWGDNLKLEGLVRQNVINKGSAAKLNSKIKLDRDAALKMLLSKHLKASYSKKDWLKFFKIANWIVQEWGGIRGGDDVFFRQLIKEFIVNLNKDSKQFKRMASVTKVISHMYPEDHIIYDSRVTTSMNWILLSEQAGEKFFPIPEGRNSKLAALDIETLVRLNKVGNYGMKQVGDAKNKKFISTKDKSVFIEKSAAYDCLRKLILEVNQLLWDKPEFRYRKKYPFYTEILLFTIADDMIFKDIVKRASLTII